MLGADFYETEAEVTSILAEGRVPVGIGENTKIKYKQPKSLVQKHAKKRIVNLFSHFSSYLCLFFLIMCRGCIIDKNARIGKNVVIANSEVGTVGDFLPFRVGGGDSTIHEIFK